MALPCHAQEPTALAGAPRKLVEFRIGFPEGKPVFVDVGFGERSIALVLPRGVALPLDYGAASDGMLRGGEAIPVSEDRIRLELKLAGGMLDGIAFDPQGIVLRFTRRASLAAATAADASSYRLGPEDKILVTINGQPELSRQAVIGAGGKISAPLVGEVTAEGLTPQELASRLAELLAQDYLVDPQVDIEVMEYKSKWVMVLGEIRTPGRVALRSRTTLKEVLSEAGGLTDEAGEEISISRSVPGRSDSQTVTVSRSAFESGDANPELQSGDIVNVKKVAFVYIQGEVRNPGRVRIEKGMTLYRAITLVGGPTEWAKTKAVEMMRDQSSEPPQVYNLRDIERKKVPDPALVGGEIIIVKRRIL